MIRILVIIVSFSLCVASTSARTIWVGDDASDDFDSIQPAIDDANDWDEIVVRDGVYKGPSNKNLTFEGKLIVLRSENGPETTIIDCNNDGRAFDFNDLETADAKVVGFTIQDGNVVGDSGGAVRIEASGPTIENCVIKHNRTTVAGGAIFCSNYGYPSFCPVIADCVIAKNQADGSGGGIYADRTYILVENCVITSNRSGYFGGGILLYSIKGPNYYHFMDIVNCTIHDNNDFMGGGGIYHFYDAVVLVANSIVYGNAGTQIKTYEYSTLPPRVEYCNVRGGYWGIGNIDADPCFADTTAGDYHLKSQAGRWAGEQLTRSCDIDDDGFVDLFDFAFFAADWQRTGSNSRGDFNRNGLVDELDLRKFAEYYLKYVSHGDWVYDDVTSRCVDAGNPGIEPNDEPADANNIRINMGAYGRTVEASTAPEGWALLADLDNSGCVNFRDYAYLLHYWQLKKGENLPEYLALPGDLSRDPEGMVDMIDMLILFEQWLNTTSWHK